MKIVFLFYSGMTALDVIGPHELLSRLPGCPCTGHDSVTAAVVYENRRAAQTILILSRHTNRFG
jgi:hypothetical protein